MKRQLIACALSIGLGTVAHAQDGRIFVPVDLTPGSPTYWNWSGFYVGGQAGASVANLDPGSGTTSMIAYILRQTTLENEAHVSQWQQLRNATTQGTNYGGFFGYNSQWEDVVLGFEVNYSFGSMKATSADSIARSYLATDGYLYDVSVDSQVAVAIKDYVSFRTRAGYAMGRFLPYGMIGATVGRAEVNRAVTVSASGTDVTNNPPLPPVQLGPTTMQQHRKNAVIYGYNAGLGLDYGITSNVFLRAEYEFTQFFPMSGVSFTINTARVGAAVKF